MAKTTRQGGASNAAAGAVLERRGLILADTDGVIDGDLRVTGDLIVEGTLDGGPGPTTEGLWVEGTSDQGFTVDTLNIDLVAGLAVTIPAVAEPAWVEALIAFRHSVTSAVGNAILCRTDPAPTTILNALGMGFACVTTIGFQTNCLVWCRIAPNTPCTVQLYVAGTAGTLTVLGQTYAPQRIRWQRMGVGS
jgi:hypothetical protein